MRKPNLTVPSVSLSRDSLPKIAAVVGIGAAALVSLMSVVPAIHDLFNWVPVSNDMIVIDSALKLVVGALLIAVALLIVLPIAMAVHTVGHAVAGHLIGMKLLAVRLGPVLYTPQTAGNRWERLPVASKMDLLTGWTQFDDSPLPTWNRQRAWQVMTGGGPAMNLLASFVFALLSIATSGFTYVLFRQMVWINLAVCVATVIPWVWARFEYTSDGKNLLGLFLDEGDGADALMEKMRDEVVVGPLRPASWPREREAVWESRLRNAAETDEGRSEQMETMIYLFLQAIDRGDKDTAWRWVQAMHHVIARVPNSTDLAIDSGRVMCALYSARWDRDFAAATTMLNAISPRSGMRYSPWFTVASAATAWSGTFTADAELPDDLVAAQEIAEAAREQLTDPAKLHGVDQLMLGISEAISADLETELHRHNVGATPQRRTPASAQAAAEAFGQSPAA